MQRKSTIKLTIEEIELISDRQFHILKKSAMNKISVIFTETAENLILEAKTMGLQMGSSYKLSKGENYHGYPYLVVDLPKIDPTNFFMLSRIVFWWGHGFSFQLMIKQENVNALNFIKALVQAVPEVRILSDENLWENRLSDDSYPMLASLSEVQKAVILKKEWIKIALGSDIKKTDSLHENAVGFYRKTWNVLLASQQGF